MDSLERPLAVITGASSGIGYQLAKISAERGYDLILAADDQDIKQAVDDFRALGASVEAMQTDLSTLEGVESFYDFVTDIDRPVDVLMANAGHGLGHGFLDQDLTQAKHVIDTNIVGTIALIHKIGNDMRARNAGRILITGSIAGFMPGTFQAIYNASKAFLNSFSFALRNELEETDVTVTCLMPGATDTKFFERADMLDTKVAQDKKDDPADVAKAGFEAMLNGEGDVVSGWKNKVMTTLANVTPSGVLAEQHRKMSEPGSGDK